MFVCVCVCVCVYVRACVRACVRVISVSSAARRSFPPPQLFVSRKSKAETHRKNLTNSASLENAKQRTRNMIQNLLQVLPVYRMAVRAGERAGV